MELVLPSLGLKGDYQRKMLALEASWAGSGGGSGQTIAHKDAVAGTSRIWRPIIWMVLPHAVALIEFNEKRVKILFGALGRIIGTYQLKPAQHRAVVLGDRQDLPMWTKAISKIYMDQE